MDHCSALSLDPSTPTGKFACIPDFDVRFHWGGDFVYLLARMQETCCRRKKI